MEPKETPKEAPKEKPVGRSTVPPVPKDPRFVVVDRVLKKCQYSQDALIEVLHAAQEASGFLSDDLMEYVARQLKLPASWVFGVATFYHFFTLKPKGEHTCIVCMGTACYVKRAGDVVTTLEKEYGVKAGQTTPDGKLTISTARCLGNCGLAPMLVLDGKVLGTVTPEGTIAEVKAVLAKPPAVATAGTGGDA